MKKTKVAIVGCGMISDTYFKAAQTFRNIEVVACCDIIEERMKSKAEEYNCKAVTFEEIAKDPEIEIVLNLTPPLVHYEIAMATLKAGKHAYSEKPFGVNQDEANEIMAFAKSKNLRVGCAPDTFMGAGQQTARKVLDDGWIGKPLSGMAMVFGRGPETWPHAPFFYTHGAGPMLDLGPYYITALVNLLGPAKKVTAMAKKGFETRRIGDKVDEKYQDLVQPFGEYPVDVNTHLTGVIEFECGAYITVTASFDVLTKDYFTLQIQGTEGTMIAPDPNAFDGDIKIFRKGFEDWKVVPTAHIYSENSRSIGVADMVYSLEKDIPHRANGEMACHVLEIMLAFDKSAKEDKPVVLTTTCKRPEPMPLGLDKGEVGF